MRLLVVVLLVGRPPSFASRSDLLRTWAHAMPVFAGTAFAHEHLMRPDGDLRRAFPKVTTSAKAGGNENSPTIRPEDLPNTLRGLPANVIYIPAPHSSSPDLFVVLKDNIVGLQFKHIAPQQAMSFSELKGEIIKSRFFAETNKLFSLVIVAFAVGSDLRHWLVAKAKENTVVTETPHLWRIKAGEHKHPARAATPASVRSASTKAGTPVDVHDSWRPDVLKVPKNTEVIILKPGSETGVGALLGKAPYACLRDVLTGRKTLAKMLRAEPLPGWLGMAKSVAIATSGTAAGTLFDLERFLRLEAEIDAGGVDEYMPRLRKNKVDEAALRVLATEPKHDIEARLERWGISSDADRLKLARAIVTRFSGSHKM